MSAELRARVLAAAAAEPSPARAATRRRRLVVGMLGAASGVAAFVVFALMLGGRLVGLAGDAAPGAHVERSLGLLVATTGGALAIAAAALRLALSRGRSMLGRTRGWLLFGGVLVPIGLFAWKVTSSYLFGAATIEWPERPGLKCLALSLLVAIGPLVSFLVIRRSAPMRPALNGAVLGFAAGACAWVAVDLWCPVAYVPHLLLGHLLPMLILAVVGALLGEMLLSPRWKD